MYNYAFKIKVTGGQLQGLYAAFGWLVQHWEIENDHDALLYCHAIAFRRDFEKKLHNRQVKYGLKFDELQALAFCQIWNDNYKHLHAYEKQVVFDMNGNLDKYRKSLVPIQYANEKHTVINNQNKK